MKAVDCYESVCYFQSGDQDELRVCVDLRRLSFSCGLHLW